MFTFRQNQDYFSSPISRLPIELLSEIFSLCLLTADDNIPSSEDEEYTTPIITSDTVRVPFTLASVNRRWRAVALGQSSLWSNLCITAELIGEAVPLKLEPDQETFSFPSSQTLHTKQIIYCLQRSRQASLNVFIDARDPEWNFAEPGVGVDAVDIFAPQALFSSQHMIAFISLLVPHITRWKSLTILTDTWAPMHAALTTINPHITSFGAPRLESMTLMRCNDFVSYSPHFQPQDLREPRFLSCVGATPSMQPLLPSLEHLSLRGVHVDWDALGSALESSCLSTLELTSHCIDVRPSMTQFHRLLATSPGLRTFTLTGSGPEVSDTIESVLPVPEADPEPVLLERLQSINIGYRTALEGRTVLKLLNAPNARSLVLEDATYPGDPEEVNASSLLYYLGSKEFVGSRTSPTDANERGALIDDRKQPVVPRRRKSSVYPPNAELLSPQPAFPILERVTMKNVKSSSRSLRALFTASPHLRYLELVGMSMSAVQALLPGASSSISPPSTCPCPRLHSLCIRDSQQLQVQDLDFIVGDLTTARESWGACALREVDIHVDAAKAACVAAAASPGTKVNIISDDEEELEADDAEDGMDLDPFKPGGAFNDPLFDQYYSDQIVAR